jgi:hypothetical protein
MQALLYISLMDACLMGSVEVAYELRNKADFIIASPTEVIYMGYPYDRIIPELTRKQPDLKKVASDYFNFYNEMPGIFRSASIFRITEDTYWRTISVPVPDTVQTRYYRFINYGWPVDLANIDIDLSDD